MFPAAAAAVAAGTAWLSTWATTAGTGAAIAAAHPIGTAIATGTIGGTIGGTAAGLTTAAILNANDDNRIYQNNMGNYGYPQQNPSYYSPYGNGATNGCYPGYNC